MRKLLYAAAFLALLVAASASSTAYAESLRIQPLQYQTELKKGEKKKGYVDITNPANETVTVNLYVNGFSQVDDHGNLTFFDSEQIRNGLLLDYDTATIGAHQTLRLYFIADGAKLPTGDVFGVIFAETKSAGQPGTNTTVRVGSLVMITNQTPGPRDAEITKLDVPFMQLGDGVGGVIAVKNPAPKNTATGFFPAMTVELISWGGKRDFKGPLVFAHNTRTFDFYMPANLFGFYLVKVKANNTEKSTAVFLMTGWWKIVAPLLAMLLIGGTILLKKYVSSGKKLHLKRH